jgi:hypothetical protein
MFVVCAAVYYGISDTYDFKADNNVSRAHSGCGRITPHFVSKLKLQIVSTVIKSILLLAVVFVPQASVRAHEIPTDVVIQTILKPEGSHINFLVRVPLAAMRDVNFPESGPGYLVISQADETIRDAAIIWVAREVALYENGELLDDWEIAATRLSLPSDRSFDSYAGALESINRPRLPDETDLYRDQAMLDVLIRYPIDSADSEFSIAPEFARLGLRTTTVLRYQLAEGAERIFEFSGDPGLVRLDPRWHHAFFRFVQNGITHILDGIDHILFVICLLIPYRRIRPLIAIITSFTIAHSITLIASAFGLVPKASWFPPLIETLIAASVVYMAFENIVGTRWQRRWMVAFGFGLVHGFGFSFALSETLQFAGTHLLTSLLAFNLGVELGQLVIIVVAVPLLNLFFRKAIAERMGTIILSAILAHSGWHWMSVRASELSAFSFTWPVLDYAFLASMMRWTMLLLIVATTVWFLFKGYRRFLDDEQRGEL